MSMSRCFGSPATPASTAADWMRRQRSLYPAWTPHSRSSGGDPAGTLPDPWSRALRSARAGGGGAGVPAHAGRRLNLWVPNKVEKGGSCILERKLGSCLKGVCDR